jgi:hypothetical protein
MPDSKQTKITEELAAAPLAEFIRDLGIAVAEANNALALGAGASASLIYAINSAEIEVNVALSMEQTKTAEIGGSLKLSVFSMNASYKSTFGFKEEASSKIKITLEARPKPVNPAPGGGG